MKILRKEEKKEGGASEREGEREMMVVGVD